MKKAMRVMAGSLKGAELQFTKSPDVRPATQKVREAVFDILQDRVVGARMLDLFCGSGSVGIEALSRGASHVDFVDLVTRDVSANLRRIDITGKASVYRTDARKAIAAAARRGKQYDIVFIGAPYPYPHTEAVISEIGKKEILAASGVLLVEHDRSREMSRRAAALELRRAYSYGQTAMSLYQYGEEHA
jgi:16S rRNA (guanine(966)-N(2))-methyltransferase RsmD